MYRQKTITLDATVQQLSVACGFVDKYRRILLQPDGANANAVFVGATSALTSSDYGVRLAAASGGIPPAPWLDETTLPEEDTALTHLFVTGTNGEKLHVFWVPRL